MSRPAAALGLLRSLLVYDAIPFRGRRLRRHYAALVPSGSLCFDVGAHTGSRVRAWRRLGARVVAVEPQPLFVALLLRRFARDPGVVVEPVALGASAGRARLLVSARTPTVTTLSADWARTVATSPGFERVRWAEGGEVAVETLDAMIARHGRPAFVKLDVEGFEAQVLSGLSDPVPAISFEVVPAARAGALACIERLSALGDYRFNWSVGETHRLALEAWTDADGARALIDSLAPGGRSGDVYARLVGT